jgi:hypothetical protein
VKTKAQILLAGFFLLISFGARAEENCIDSGQEQTIRQSLKLETLDKDSYDRCKADSHTYKMLQALTLIHTIRFQEGALGQPYNEDILPTDFWGYFSKRATVIQDESSCSEGVLAFVYGFARNGVVHVCPLLYSDTITIFERAETMLHEVRHFEGYSHVTCTRGPRQGQGGACDESIDEKGSYAVTVESLTKMAMTSKDIPHVQKTMLKILALTYANETFNTPVRARDLSAFYLVSSDHKGYVYSDAGLVQVASLEGDKVISRGSALAVFPRDKSDAYTADVFSTSLEASPAMGTFSAKYNSLPVTERPEVVDIMNVGYLSASVTSSEIQGSLRSTMADTTVKLPFVAKAVYSSPEVGQDNEDSLYVVDGQDQMFRVQFLAGQNYNISAFANPLAGLKQIAVFNDSRLALNQSGQVVIEENGRWTAFSPLQGRTFTQMTRPFLWDQYFEDGESLSLAVF